MKRTLHWIAAVALALVSAAPVLAASPSPLGQWQVATGEARYQVTICGSGLCAKLVWLRPDARTADNLALLNTYVVKGAEPAGSRTWSGNVTFNGQDYSGTITLVNNNLMQLKGCAGVFCQTYQFSRV